MLIHHLPDNAAQEPDKIGIEGSMRYLTDLGVKLDEVVVLSILTELGAPTMGEFTRDGFVHGWQNHRYVLHTSANRSGLTKRLNILLNLQRRNPSQTTRSNSLLPPLPRHDT